MKLNEPRKRISHARPSLDFSRESFASSCHSAKSFTVFVASGRFRRYNFRCFDDEFIITPHTAIASLFGRKAELLEWKIPRARQIAKRQKRQNGKFTIVYPASTVGRKGCYELREALGDLDAKLIILGAELEGADFRQGIDCEKGSDDWLELADLVVLPAFVEHKPRRLLQAVANQISVVASKPAAWKI